MIRRPPRSTLFPSTPLFRSAKAARRHGGIYASHMRNEGIRIDDALNELYQIARQADIPAEVSHLKVSGDRKSTRLNSSHDQISYAVFCLKKKNIDSRSERTQ